MRATVAAIALLLVAQSSAAADEERVALRVSDRLTYTGIVRLTDEPAPGVKTKAGTLAEVAGTFTLVEENGHTTTRVHVPGTVYGRGPAAIELKGEQPSCGTGAPQKAAALAFAPWPVDPCEEASTAVNDAYDASRWSCRTAKPGPFAPITALVVYTDAVANRYGTQIRDDVHHAIAETNLAFFSSNVDARLHLGTESSPGQDLRRMRECIFRVGYAEDGSSATDLSALLTGSGALSVVAGMRRRCSADVVILLHNRTTDNRSGRACVMEHLSAAYAPYARAIVYYPSMIADYAFVHELGHMMGAGHENGGGMCQDSRAYIGAFRTIMASSRPDILMFSDPHYTHDAATDNARTVRVTARAVSLFVP